MAEAKFNGGNPVVLCDKCCVIVYYIDDKFIVTKENVEEVYASIKKDKTFCDKCEKRQ